MADDLARRIETATEGLITAVFPSEQTLKFGETEKAGSQYFIIKADRGEEDPPRSGVFWYNVEVTGHGQFTQTNIDDVDSIFANSYSLSEEMRTAGTGQFVLPGGDSCDISAGSKTGVGVDAEYTWAFAIWAQTQQISDAA